MGGVVLSNGLFPLDSMSVKSEDSETTLWKN